MSKPSQRELLDGLTRIASRAAKAILSITQDDLHPRAKADHSPVTAADEASETTILQGLALMLPDVPVISEESVGRHRAAPPAGRFLLVDPLDGTREFIAGFDEYTVNIALVQDGVPVAGVIAAPARGQIWRGGVGLGAERLALAPGAEVATARERIHTRRWITGSPQVLLSRSHPEVETLAYIERLGNPQRMPCGSSLKFCLIAEGAADLYPRFARLSEWDVAAGHALLQAAGGGIVSTEGEAFQYGHAGFRLPPFIAYGDRASVRGL